MKLIYNYYIEPFDILEANIKYWINLTTLNKSFNTLVFS